MGYGVVKMAFFDTFMIKRTINEEIIILLTRVKAECILDFEFFPSFI